MEEIVVVTFDVDGTICTSVGEKSNRVHKAAFERAIRETWGVKDPSVDAIQHHGSTDPLILLQLASHYGVEKQKAIDGLKQAQDIMIAHVNEHQNEIANGIELIAGVRECLTALSKRDDVVFGLVTGNLEPIGWHKMRSLGIEEFFGDETSRFGGFSTDYCGLDWEKKIEDRAEMLKKAIEKVAKLHPTKKVKHVVHIGDAPTDVQAGESAGASVIGVTTGIFKREQLQPLLKCEHSVILDGLKDLDEVFSALRL